jgi:hypothetical protein
MQTNSRTMTAKSRFNVPPLIVPPLRVGMHPETLRVSPLTFPTPVETHPCRSRRSLRSFDLPPRESMGNFLQSAVLSMN